ncbi:hypothetical protein [Spirillospora sp. NPDC047279]|uniref:hypothetical protein n=1 Tax=Spirillospora sp. NPDC047279 TaxID=3155478 RepID=UPI00340D9F18
MNAAVKKTRAKAIVLGAVGLLVAGAGAAVLYVTVIHGKDLRYATQAELRNSMQTTAGSELRTRGVALGTALNCKDMNGWTKTKMRVACTGTTADKKDVQVFASGEDRSQEQYYTILVDGRPVVQNAGCLGTDCQKKD